MGRRTWIKIYSEKWLRGSIRQESAELRGIFIDLLSLAGDSAYGDNGMIKLAENVGFTDEVLCGILNLSASQWKKGKNALANQENPDENRIKFTPIGQGYAINIINWSKYQGEYQRQKKYRIHKNIIEDGIEVITEDIQYSYAGHKAKREADPKYKINDAMKSAIYDALKYKKAGRSWEKVVDYTLTKLMNHLELKFKGNMSWENYGEVWHIDHIIPKSKFHFQNTNDSEFKICWALENLQPLFKSENLSKQDKVTNEVTTKVTNLVTVEKEKEKENSSCPKLKFTDEDMKLVKELETSIKEIDSNHRFTGGQRREKWANTFRLIREQDRREAEDIRVVMVATFKDSFWSTVIQSADNFRKHYNQLRAKMLGGKRNGKKEERTAPYH